MRGWRWGALVLLLFMGTDFLDPSPGIFFFDHERILVAGVAEVKPALSAPAPDHAPPDLGGPPLQLEPAAAPSRIRAVAARARPGRWDTGRSAVSFHSSPSSPDDH